MGPEIYMAGRMREHFPLKSDNSGELICAAERSRGNQIIMDFFFILFFLSRGPIHEERT